MRRGDRAVTDDAAIDAIIRSCHCCRLGFCDGGAPYIVPMSFGYEHQDGRRVFYFHSAKEGRKVSLAAAAPSVGFELDTGYALVPGDVACAYSARFQSVIGTGRIHLVEDAAEKQAGLRSMMEQLTQATDWAFSPAMVERVCVLKLEVETLSCKVHP